MAIGTPIQRQFDERTGVAGTANVAFATNPTVGTKLILMVTSNAAKTISSVSDTQGNTWVVNGSGSDGTRTVCFAECQVVNALVAGTDTFTITFSVATASTNCIWLHEVSGLVTGTAFDVSAAGTGTGTAMATAATGTLAQAAEYVQAGFRTTGAGSTGTKGSAFTDVTTPRSTTNPGSACEYEIVAATTAVTGDYAWASSGSWVACVATYKGAAAVVAPRNVAGWITRSGGY